MTKFKGLLITTIIFFLLVNTVYFWEGKLGLVAFPVLLILVVVYIGLLVVFFRHLYFSIKEKFENRSRLVILSILIVVIISTLLKPNGLVDFDNLSGNDLLVASKEGGGNSTTTLKLKENNKFRVRIVSFGVNEIRGTYKIQNDTISFKYNESEASENYFYKYAVIKQSKYNDKKRVIEFIRVTSSMDTIRSEFSIRKNELWRLK